MLVLACSIGSKVFIGEGSFIQVCDMGNGRVRLGIEFPKDVRIEREVVRERRLREEANKEAA